MSEEGSHKFGVFPDEELVLIESEYGEMIISAQPNSIHFRVQKGAYKSLRGHVTCFMNYPTTPLNVEIHSNIVHESLVKKLNDHCSKLVKKNCGSFQVPLVLNFLKDFIDNNLLIPAWEEILTVKSLMGTADRMKMKERTGVISFTIKEDRFWMKFNAVVPENYPVDLVRIEVLSHNFPEELVANFLARLEGQQHHILHGNTIEQFRRTKALKEKEEDEKTVSIPTSNTLNDLKHDIRFLYELGQLDDVADHDKNLRRKRKRMVKSETTKEIELLETHENEKTDDIRSLFSLVSYVILDFARKFPSENCPVCEERVISADKVKSNPNSENYVRLFCSDWYHKRCIEKFLSKPPFQNKVCLACSRPISHKKYNKEYISNAEQKWSMKQRNQMEIDSIIDLMGFIDDNSE